MSEQLKPCPFCGGEGAYVYGQSFECIDGEYRDFDSWHVECCACPAQSVAFTTARMTNDEARSQAALAWNRRAPSPSAIVAALEAAHKEACARARGSGIRGDVWTALDVGVETGLLKAIDIVKELSK